MFDPSSFDVAAYLARIGYDGPLTADGQTLARIARLHPAAIPFENLNVLLGRPVPLDIASLQQKLVRERRGGWCFEHNVLLGTALAAIGFDVEGLSARVKDCRRACCGMLPQALSGRAATWCFTSTCTTVRGSSMPASAD
jgi:N-hydroxyarylamine O-acetyltransferase